MAGLLKRAPLDVRFALDYNYKSRILQWWRACQDGHHLMTVLIFTTATKEVFWNGGLDKTGTIWCPFCFTLQLHVQKMNSAMEGLTKRAPFDVRFDFHYNYKSRACQIGHHLMSVLIFRLQKKYSAMEGLTKRAPFDVRFALHYNYKSRILQ